jgi:triacylglycerol lipase
MTWQLALVVAVAVVLLMAAAAALILRARRRRPVTPPAADIPRHPVVLVHGLMGFDEIGVPGMPALKARYFRGIVEHLERRGVVIHRPRLPAAASVPERAARLAAFLRALPPGRVNVIAHSMGGLDARWAISRLGAGDRVASLVTIGTPHRGTPMADLAASAPARLVRAAAAAVGATSEAFDWLTAAGAAREELPDDPRVFYACVVTRTSAAAAGVNPALLASHLYVRVRAGSNDGLVPTSSQRWGETLAELDADHWAQIGWSLRTDATALYDAILARLAARGL